MKEIPSLTEVISKSPIKVIDGRFAIVKLNHKPSITNYFMITDDGEEITIVIEESQLGDAPYRDIQSWFKLFQAAVSIPFITIGFLAAVTQAIAQKRINVLVISTFSYDCLLIRENDARSAIEALKEIGFPIAKGV